MTKAASNNGVDTKTEPLIVLINKADDDDNLCLYMPQLGKFQTCSALLGLMIGFFIYISTLGVEFVGVLVWGGSIQDKTDSELFRFSLGWNICTTLIAIIILACLRQMVLVVFRTTIPASTPHKEDILGELLSHLECRFAVGTLVGLCISWNVSNFVLGLPTQIFYSIGIMGGACLWWSLTLALFGRPARKRIVAALPDNYENDAVAECPLLTV